MKGRLRTSGAPCSGIPDPTLANFLPTVLCLHAAAEAGSSVSAVSDRQLSSAIRPAGCGRRDGDAAGACVFRANAALSGDYVVAAEQGD